MAASVNVRISTNEIKEVVFDLVRARLAEAVAVYAHNATPTPANLRARFGDQGVRLGETGQAVFVVNEASVPYQGRLMADGSGGLRLYDFGLYVVTHRSDQATYDENLALHDDLADAVYDFVFDSDKAPDHVPTFDQFVALVEDGPQENIDDGEGLFLISRIRKGVVAHRHRPE